MIWPIFDLARADLKARSLITDAEMFHRLASHLAERKNPPFYYAVVDEAQDINPPQLRFLAALGGGLPNSLFFAGDLGQRIFQQAFSWKALGIDIDRSNTLHLNYRTSHQIRHDLIPRNQHTGMLKQPHSTVTDLARLRGWSTSQPRRTAM